MQFPSSKEISLFLFQRRVNVPKERCNYLLLRQTRNTLYCTLWAKQQFLKCYWRWFMFCILSIRNDIIQLMYRNSKDSCGRSSRRRRVTSMTFSCSPSGYYAADSLHSLYIYIYIYIYIMYLIHSIRDALKRYVVYSPTNALLINLVKSFKFTLKYTIISLLHVSVFNDHH